MQIDEWFKQAKPKRAEYVGRQNVSENGATRQGYRQPIASYQAVADGLRMRARTENSRNQDAIRRLRQTARSSNLYAVADQYRARLSTGGDCSQATGIQDW